MRDERCAEEGALRAYLDRQLDGADTARLERHLPICPACRLQLGRVRDDAALVDQTLRCLRAPAGEDAAAREARAWAELRGRRGAVSWSTRPKEPHSASSGASRPGRATAGAEQWGKLFSHIGGVWAMMIQGMSGRQRAAVAAALAAVLLVGVLMMPAGQAAAIGFLSLFRVQKFAPVTIDPNRPFDGLGLAYLEHLGKVTQPDRRSTDGGMTTASLSELSARAGITLRKPSALPAGVADNPQVRTFPAQEASFTLDRTKAEAYLKSSGAPNPSVPAKLDGARLTLKVPMAVSMTYGGKEGQDGLPRLMIGQLASPSASVEGNATPAELRDFLLGLPVLPPETVAQLRAIDDWTQTVPIPVPKDRTAWREVSLNGTPALLLTDKSVGMAALIWQKDGVVTAVAGALSEREILDVALSLR